MIYCNLLKLSFILDFHNKKCVELSLASFGSLKYDCVIKASEMLKFLTLINSSVTIRLSFFFTNQISNHIIKNY